MHSRTLLWLAAALFATACTTTAPQDGMLVDNPPSRNFNDPANWTPRGVPTSTATLPRNDVFPPSDYIEITQPASLGAIQQGNGRFVLLLEPGGDTALTGQGLTVCCKAGIAIVSSVLTGNVTVAAGEGLGYGVSGGGTIKGDVTVSGGAFGAGGRDTTAGLRTLTIDRSITVDKAGTMYVTVTPSVTTQFVVHGPLRIVGGNTGLLIDMQDMDAGPARIVLTAVTANGGVTGKFAAVGTTSRWYKADVAYTASTVSVTLTRQGRPRQLTAVETRQLGELRAATRVARR